VSTEGRLKTGHCSGVHHMGGVAQDCALLIIPGLGLGRTFRSSIFHRTQTNVNFIEPHFHFT
jgi:hypothetical protein